MISRSEPDDGLLYLEISLWRIFWMSVKILVVVAAKEESYFFPICFSCSRNLILMSTVNYKIHLIKQLYEVNNYKKWKYFIKFFIL